FLGKLDPKTGKIVEYPVPVLDPKEPKGALDIGLDPEGNVFMGMMYQGVIARFDPKTEKFETWKSPKFGQGDAARTAMVTPTRVDAKTMKPTPFATPTPNSGPRRGHMDDQDRLWFAEFRGNNLGMFDTKTEKFTEYRIPTPWTNPYDAVLDRSGYAWTGGMSNDHIARVNTKTGEITEYLLPRMTNVRRVNVDNSTNPPTFWVGNNLGASVIKLEPLEP